MMAEEYETRALRLQGVPREAKDGMGASQEMFKTETDALGASDQRINHRSIASS
jgi:hypothetical protein